MRKRLQGCVWWGGEVSRARGSLPQGTGILPVLPVPAAGCVALGLRDGALAGGSEQRAAFEDGSGSTQGNPYSERGHPAAAAGAEPRGWELGRELKWDNPAAWAAKHW